MTNAPYPEHPSRPPGPGRPGPGGTSRPGGTGGPGGPGDHGGHGGGPPTARPSYGPPPQRHAGDPGASHGPHYNRGIGQGDSVAQGMPVQKGLVGALLDVNFNHLVTTKLIKMFYVIALMLVSLSTLSVVAIGLWVFQLRNGWFLGGLIIIAAPIIWIFEALMVRILMEAIVVRFKTAEYLRAIKDKL